MQRTAEISPDRSYRYRLGRIWKPDAPACLFIMLNPSTADANVDDATIRRCLDYAARWGYGSLLVGNLFAFRTTYPSELKAAAAPIGPDNDEHLRQLLHQAELVVCAWGTHGGYLGRDQEVLATLNGRGQALVVTQDGYPGHPVRLAKTLKPVPYKHQAIQKKEAS